MVYISRMKDTWRIALAEENMDVGQIDNMVFGNDTCHSFLVLINPDNEIVSELHGYPYKKTTRTEGQCPNSYLSSLASSVNMMSAFESVCRALDVDDAFPRLKVINTNGKWRTDLSEVMQVVFSGDKQTVMSEWLDACSLGGKINNMDLFYTPVSYVTENRKNCNTATRAFIHAMDITVDQTEFYLEPHGYENEINKIKDLAEFNTRAQYSEADVQRYLDYVAQNLAANEPVLADHNVDMRGKSPEAVIKPQPVIGLPLLA